MFDITGTHTNLPRYDVYMWSCLDILMDGYVKTNNAIEGFHSTFKKRFQNFYYSITKLVEVLIEAEESIRQKMGRILAGETIRRKQKYVAIERNLINKIRNTEIKKGKNYVFSIIYYVNYENLN